jgi:hypothetical protein
MASECVTFQFAEPTLGRENDAEIKIERAAAAAAADGVFPGIRGVEGTMTQQVAQIEFKLGQEFRVSERAGDKRVE